MIHVQMIESPFTMNGVVELVDIDYFCSASCYEIHTGLTAVGTAWPCGSETDYGITERFCAHCEALLWKGLQTDELV